MAVPGHPLPFLRWCCRGSGPAPVSDRLGTPGSAAQCGLSDPFANDAISALPMIVGFRRPSLHAWAVIPPALVVRNPKVKRIKMLLRRGNRVPMGMVVFPLPIPLPKRGFGVTPMCGAIGTQAVRAGLKGSPRLSPPATSPVTSGSMGRLRLKAPDGCVRLGMAHFGALSDLRCAWMCARRIAQGGETTSRGSPIHDIGPCAAIQAPEFRFTRGMRADDAMTASQRLGVGCS
jgi:hypothetical protein